MHLCNFISCFSSMNRAVYKRFIVLHLQYTKSLFVLFVWRSTLTLNMTKCYSCGWMSFLRDKCSELFACVSVCLCVCMHISLNVLASACSICTAYWCERIALWRETKLKCHIVRDFSVLSFSLFVFISPFSCMSFSPVSFLYIQNFHSHILRHIY